MSYQSPSSFTRAPVDGGRQLDQLRRVLALVEELAGRPTLPSALDEGAQTSGVYSEALPVVRKRFDALASETAAWSAAGVEALLAAGEKRSRAAARRLADELQTAVGELTKLLHH
jgi:hypothetical protein